MVLGKVKISISKLLAVVSLLTIPAVWADSLDPRMYYLDKGLPIQRGILLGDPSNWGLTIEGRAGKSAKGKVEVMPADLKGNGDALQIKWSKKSEQGNFGLYGAPVNLAPYVQAANLVIDLKVDVTPDMPVTIGMDCGYPCGAQIALNPLLKEIPKGQWISLPIPLNCFKSENFDISKIAGPLVISTAGKFTLSIANVHLEKRSAEDVGCN